MKKSEIVFGLLRIPCDALAVFGALILSYELRLTRIDLIPRLQLLEPAQTLPEFSEYLFGFVVPGVFIFLILAAMLRLYTLIATQSAWIEVGKTIITALVWIVLIMAWYFLVRKQLFYSRILLVHSAFFIAMFATTARVFLILIQRALLKRGIGVRAVVSVGAKALVSHAQATLEHDVHYRYLGHCDDLIALKSLTKKSLPDLVLQTDPHPQSAQTLMLADFCRNQHIEYAFLPPLFADTPQRLSVDRLGLLPFLRFRPTPLDGWGRVYKRCFDVVLSSILLMGLLPLFCFLILIILCESGWPIFYVAIRVGEHGRKKFSMFKFRSMVRDADAMKEKLRCFNHRQDGPLFKLRDDPRITRFGQMLRRWSLDELPQLLNVICGQMSLVGPRPHLPEEVGQYAPEQHRVFAVKPGLTGLAQISGRSDLTFYEEVQLDLRYIEEWSLWLDLWILWRTVVVVLSRKGAD
ncbi:hypothetical protein A2635_02855 [Candidatus Peribacteria bacterium RIFCSPHIGHO2_01_FULL_51_9]|nr:MAG: hypothetical protein A2635_02855 [Candidatus Peribacteria bacterium RIFCSPHIGHO2_01_FULL_51_9]